MLFLKTNDPFHFGHLTRAMFNVLRIETKDSWDQVRGGRPLCAAAFDWLRPYLYKYVLLFYFIL